MMNLVIKIQKEYINKLSKSCERLNIDNINFPPTIKNIEQFEKVNPDISITIFKYGGFHKIKEEDENVKEGILIEDIRVSLHALKRKHLVELLKKGEKTHFTTIKSISRLLHGSKYDKDLYCCKKCYCSFKSEEKLNHSHVPLCSDVENVFTIIPEKK